MIDKQVAYCDFSSQAFTDDLRLIDGNLLAQKEKFLDFLRQRAKSRILAAHPDWQLGKTLHPQALHRLAEINIQIDCTRSLSDLVKEYQKHLASTQTASTAESNNTKNFLFKSEATNYSIEREIDKRSYRGGQTRLHIEVMNGDFGAVRTLVETQKARTDIKDNSGKTAYEYAHLLGFNDIADYLRNFR
jgi:hypothetical protein